jgi:GNAT superfamily N-acetyltransferase
MTLTYTQPDQIDPKDVKALADGLSAHMAGLGHPTEWKDFAFFVRDSGGAIRAGIAGNSGQGAIYIRLLWVHENERGKGLGQKLLAMAEAEGLRRGCHVAYLDTFSFQAPKFYPKFGYTEFGRVDGLGESREMSRHWFVKRIG